MSIRYYIFLLFLFFSSLVSGQKHHEISGTNLSIDLPDGFESEDHSSLISKGKAVSINVIALEGKNYYKEMNDFRERLALDRSIVITNFQEIKITGYDGQQVEYELNNGQYGTTVVFGDEKFVGILIGQYEDRTFIDEVHHVFSTVQYKVK